MKKPASISFLGIFVILILGHLHTNAQDYHLSNYNNNPVIFNPAKAGSFLGNIRVGAAYREQWQQFITTPFQTASVNLDTSFDFGFTDGDWVSGGINLYGDRSGDLTYQYYVGSTTLAYHFQIKRKKYTTVLSLGVQYGGNQRRLGLESASFGDELEGLTSTSADRNLLDDYNESNQDLGVGFQMTSRSKKGTTLVIGTSVQHLLQPQFGNNQINVRSNTESSILTPLSKQMWFSASMFASVMQSSHSLVFLFGLPYKTNPKSVYMFTPQLGMRIGDALIVGLGVDYKLWRVNVSYDVTVSSARAYNGGRGGLEIGVQRIFNVYKKPEVTPILLCPRL